MRTNQATLVFFLNFTKIFDQLQEALPVNLSSVWTNEAKLTVSLAVSILSYLMVCFICSCNFFFGFCILLQNFPLKSYETKLNLKTCKICGN